MVEFETSASLWTQRESEDTMSRIHAQRVVRDK